jgi:hypothetical protein
MFHKQAACNSKDRTWRNAMGNVQEVWWRPGGRSPFALDPTKPRLPQIGSMVGQFLIIFGGPAVGLVTIKHYPFLIEDRTLYIGGLASIVFWFLASFAMFGNESFPRGMPQFLKLQFRAGFGLCMSFLLLGLFGIANGYDTPLISSVAKHTTRHSDPAKRTYYVAVRAWPSSRAVVELGAPREVYDRLSVPLDAIGTPQADLNAMPDTGHVRLVLGQGRFGLEWLKDIELVER